MKHSRCIPGNARPAGPVGGFTLIELLVVVAIIGILIALLLPAVQEARESGRRISCVNNLKQLALATSSYEAAKKVLPRSGIVDLTTGYVQLNPFPRVTVRVFQQRSNIQFSWAVLLLPYLEEQSLYDQFQFDRVIFDQPNDPQSTFVTSYMCPSDEVRESYFVDDKLTQGRRFAKGNYAAFCTPYHVNLQMIHRGALVGEEQPLRRVTDGLSSTLLFSEVRTLDNPRDERGVWSLPWTGASLLAFDMHHSEDLPFDAPYVAEAKYAYQTQLPNTLGPNADMLQVCDDPAGAQLAGMPCLNANEYHWLSAAPRSTHPGGVMASYLDGHVDFLSNDIDEYAMAYLISIADAQITKASN
jgi:prepilin-type N-terminal cleavage/methylation domain-containing protein/prepilin-type processing-associated H-X9-DG protein